MSAFLRLARALYVLWGVGGALFVSATSADATDVAVGVNVVNPQWLSVSAQDAELAQLKAAGVTLMRVPLANASSISFIERAYALGIKTDAIVEIRYRPNAPTRLMDKAYPQMWSGHPLSCADPEAFRAFFAPQLEELEAKGITLAAFELGNEINWTAFNAEFPLPGRGYVFSYADLSTDPEARQIARGYLAYIEVLKVLKQVRAGSKLNRHTPILSAGLSDPGAEGPRPHSKTDAVSINATLRFLREHGLDRLVDAYGIHYYPSAKSTPATRRDNIRDLCFGEVPTGGNPAWITEWGVAASNFKSDAQRAAMINELRGDFAELAREGRLTGLLYFSWAGEPHRKRADPLSIYLQGALTGSGRDALAPMPIVNPPHP